MVKLTNQTHLPLIGIIRAARNCHKSLDKMDTTWTEDDIDGTIETLGPTDKKLIERCIDMGHDSIMEHATFTFEFTVSRVAQTQLVRHRIASYAIESTRHVVPESVIMPKSIANNEGAREEFLKLSEGIKKFYNAMCEYGIPMEDARYILPLATTGSIVYTSNLRSLRHAIAERTCFDAQWEIREVFNRIKNKLRKINPVLVYKCERFHMNCKPKCGKCLEMYNDD